MEKRSQLVAHLMEDFWSEKIFLIFQNGLPPDTFAIWKVNSLEEKQLKQIILFREKAS